MAWIFSGDKAIYAQIADKIRLRILSGEYPAGARIPSVRDIASEASANPNTVVKALSMLCESGMIYSRSTAGNFVTEDEGIIAEAREAEAIRITMEYSQAITDIGLDREKAAALLEEFIGKEEVNGNNT